MAGRGAPSGCRGRLRTPRRQTESRHEHHEFLSPCDMSVKRTSGSYRRVRSATVMTVMTPGHRSLGHYRKLFQPKSRHAPSPTLSDFATQSEVLRTNIAAKASVAIGFH